MDTKQNEPRPETSVKEIVDALSSSTIISELKVTKQSLTSAKRNNKFPAKWYWPILRLCEIKGIECPKSLFAFIKPNFDEPTGLTQFGDDQ